MREKYSQYLKEALEEKKISLQKLSQKTGISQLVLGYYLSGRSRPDKKSREAIEIALES